MRAALYFTPSRDSDLTLAAAEWLGRDPFTGESVVSDVSGSDGLVDAPRRYGFHGTLKAPFALADGKSLEQLEQAAAEFAASRCRFTVPELALGRLGSFFALVPARPCDALNAFAGDVVRHFEPFRAPLSDKDLERRRKSRLSPRQDALLCEWGYPYVFEEFRFHMTLTGSVPAEQFDDVEELLKTSFAAFTGKPLPIDALAVFVETEPGAAFQVQSRHLLVSAETEE
ncbi:DUF1045 domain-containing protein [Roseibium litorale]|uniref:DUF1045 domain-containing protein n=1 Tax=Roseibium litorale TaxID=2803841 RepID=A0ABR9CK84_9HYPH|nr:DUF1045 domain-containing protein [Roseibium litorale]MBD8891168.1 DUF1045 domain-containing protein [Roseibium litorale]